MGTEGRRKFDSEFKRSAVLLTEEPGRKIAEVARNLGIHENVLYRWKKEKRKLGQIAFPGHGRMALTPDQERIQQLEKQLADATLERDILKKAVAIFSKTPK
jgi:transposase-like protein